MSALVAVPLPDGRWIALPPEALREAVAAAAAMGLRVNAAPAGTADAATERLMNSEEIAELLGIHSTSVEAMAKAGTIPSIRVGAKALRFEPSAVKAALRARSGT
jgi:excisionase family DNA binding protein